jgi:RHS repeat-associated protein
MLRTTLQVVQVVARSRRAAAGRSSASVAALALCGGFAVWAGVVTEARAQFVSAPSALTAAPAVAVPAGAVEELPQLRTRESRSFRMPDGTVKARVYAGSVNFQDASGAWKPIDNALTASGGVLRNRANRYAAELPQTLGASAVKVTEAGQWVQLTARDAAGVVARVSDTEATYAEAWPGAALSYAAVGDALKETIVLQSAAAGRTFHFQLRASSGLSARIGDDGAIELRDADGKRAMTLSAPSMRDASGESAPVATTLERDGDGWDIALSPSRSWLAASERSFPVTIDPSVYPEMDADCLVSNETGLSGTSFCSWDFLEAGYGYADGHDHHALLKFDVQSAIPAGGDVLMANLWLYARDEEGTATKEIFARRMTSAWNSDVTWTTRDGANAWTTPGGDAAAAESSTLVNGALYPRWKFWSITDMVEGWSTGRYDNDGVMLADDGTQSTSGTMIFDSAESTNDRVPYIDVQYEPRTGSKRGWTFEDYRLSDRIDLSVNVASGNALLRQSDLRVPGGTGPDLNLGRSYNSRATNWGAFGQGWTWDLGDDVHLFVDDYQYRLWGPSGTWARFDREDDGSITSPKDFGGKLAANPDGTYTLTDNASQAKWIFDAGGRVTRREDRNGRALTFQWTTSTSYDIATITDAQGRVTTVTHDSDGQITKIVDSAAREYVYTYGFVSGGNKALLSYTDPAGGVTHYDYDGPTGRMKTITTPGGHETRLTYYPAADPREGQVASVTRITDAATGAGPKTQFDYDTDRDGSSSATVSDPNAHQTDFEFGTDGRATKVTDALGRDQKTTYTSSGNVQTYQTPNNTGATPNTSLSYDSDDNQIDSRTMTSASSTADKDMLRTHADYGPTTSGGGPVAGGAYLPKLVQNEQDLASGTAGRGTGIEYDAQGNPTKYLKGTGGSVVLHYVNGSDGKPGQMDYTRDGNANQTDYTYDTHGNLTAIKPPISGSIIKQTTLAYNGASGKDQALSRITTVTDGRQFKATYSYDNLDRITLLTYKNSANVTQATYAYEYDADGNFKKRTDTIGGAAAKVYTWTYDSLNRTTGQTLPGPQSTTYGYDAASNLTSVVDVGGTVTYTYDQINRQKTILEPGAASAITYTYTDTAGQGMTVKTALPNGVSTTQTLDPAARLSSTVSTNSAATVLQSFDYQYQTGSTPNQTAQLSLETDKDGATTAYTYDALDRLLTADHGSGDDYAYSYDLAGNLTRMVQGATTYSQAYNQANQLCWRYTGTSSNACASPPSGATTSTYDDDGEQLTGLPGTATYNAMQQLTGLGTTMFAYAGPGQDQRTQAGSTTIANNLLGVAAYSTSGTPDYFTRDENGALLSQRRPSTTAPNRRTYALTDQLGSTRTLVNETGAVVRRYAYDPYGNDTSPTGSWTTATPFRYAGGEADPTGLYHYGQRYYSPTNGRWTQQDPLNQASDLTQANRYAYVGGNPTNATDPSGLSIWDWALCASSYSACALNSANRTECAKGAGLGAVGTAAVNFGRVRTGSATLTSVAKGRPGIPAIGMGCAGGIIAR